MASANSGFLLPASKHYETNNGPRDCFLCTIALFSTSGREELEGFVDARAL